MRLRILVLSATLAPLFAAFISSVLYLVVLLATAIFATSIPAEDFLPPVGFSAIVFMFAFPMSLPPCIATGLFLALSTPVQTKPTLRKTVVMAVITTAIFALIIAAGYVVYDWAALMYAGLVAVVGLPTAALTAVALWRMAGGRSTVNVHVD